MRAKLQKLAAILGLTVLSLVAVFVFINWSYFKLDLLPETDPYTPVPAPHTQTPVQAQEKNRLFVPSLDIEAPIHYPEKRNEKEFQKFLQEGVVHYPGTALPGQAGNVYIFGHSSDYVWAKGDYKTIFSRLPKLEIGANVIVTDSSGVPYTYTVKSSRVIDADDVEVLKQDSNVKLLTLQTSYPIGTALKRYIVVAELQNLTIR